MGSGPRNDRGTRAPISELLAPHRSDPPPKSAAGAAVTIVLRSGRDDLEVLLIERTTREDDPASGQIALPGGHVDPRDADLGATAVRELEEEVGLSLSDLVPPIRFVGLEPSRRFEMTIGVFAAELAPHSPTPTRGSPTEVAHVFWLPRRAVDATERVLRDTSAGPIEVDATVYEGHVLWGFTRRVLRRFLGLERP
ncbi:MAG TPA: NUDIX domain-containing protein [Thermoplasmata archaeon]|nr:NUDIX domain-containing protein [Thermoplasmata archaeon]